MPCAAGTWIDGVLHRFITACLVLPYLTLRLPFCCSLTGIKASRHVKFRSCYSAVTLSHLHFLGAED